MKIAATKIDSFIEREINKVKAILLYGPDVGLLSERSDKIKTKILGEEIDPFLYIKYSAKSLLNDPGKLADEINSMPFIPGTKLIIIDDVSSSFSEELEYSLDNHKGDSFVLLKAGDLATSSKLRKIAENRSDILSAPCYVDDQFALANLVRRELDKESYKYPANLPNYIASLFAGNRLLVTSELSKLALYLGDRKEITEQDVQEIIHGLKEENYQEIANSVASKNINETIKEIKNHLFQGVFPVTIIRALINYFTKLLYVKARHVDGMDIEQAVSELRPPIFFKQKNIFKNHLQKWQLKEIQNFLQLLEKLEVIFKSETTYFAEIILLEQISRTINR